MEGVKGARSAAVMLTRRRDRRNGDEGDDETEDEYRYTLSSTGM
jgi:hypothetical protein